MALTINDLSPKTTGDHYGEFTVAAGNQQIVLVPLDGVITLQYNANTPTDTATVYSTVAPYKQVKDASDLSLFVEENDLVGDGNGRTVENGCTAYALDCTGGSYTFRVRILRNSTIYRS